MVSSFYFLIYLLTDSFIFTFIPHYLIYLLLILIIILGVHAIPLTGAMFNSWVSTHDYTFVDFYAPWCVWCQRLEPIWEAFAEEIEREDLPISVVRVDCSEEKELCAEHKIQVHIYSWLFLFSCEHLFVHRYSTIYFLICTFFPIHIYCFLMC